MKNILYFSSFQNSNIHFGMEKETVKRSNEIKRGKKARNEKTTATATSGLKPINYINKIVLKSISLSIEHSNNIPPVIRSEMIFVFCVFGQVRSL